MWFCSQFCSHLVNLCGSSDGEVVIKQDGKPAFEMASHLRLYAEGGRRTNRFSTCSQCVLLGSSCLWLSIKYSCISWLCFGVATSVATCFFMVVLVASLLHGLA